MPVDARFSAETPFADLGPEFSDPVRPAEFPALILRRRDDRAARSVGLSDLTDDEWLDAFGRFRPLPGAQPEPLAMRYHGHQFRTYNPDLGDGRGFLFAQVREVGGAGRLLDLATKGSGRTPYSRFGDGRLTLKGGVREVLASAMLEALGAPTSKALSLIETGESLVRHDEPSPTRSAVLTRLSHGHIRFGMFQRHAYHDRPDLVGRLVEHAAEVYFPALLDRPEAERPAALLAETVRRTARLTARWMAAGFVHGVLNTDNMNLTGESFDYGPYRFLPHADPGFTAAYFDETGLYAFGRQPEAAFWNLSQLAGCLTLVADAGPLSEALNGFGPAYGEAIGEAVVLRLGLARAEAAAEAELARALFALLTGAPALRWEPAVFDWFGGEASARRALAGPRAALYRTEAGTALRRALEAFAPDRPERLDRPYFQRSEPAELLYDQIEALWAPIAEADDWSAFQAKLDEIEAARQAYGLSPDL